jgi:diguanylate cyclase (GGDEF)-like protein/putative nucleotidyltransferase with HDIG domain
MKTAPRTFLISTITLGALALVIGLSQWRCEDPLRLAVYVAFAFAASVMKVSLPSIRGTLSVNFFFVLVGVVQLSLAETLLISSSSFLFQYLWKGKSQKPIQAAFNVASGAVATYLSYTVFHWSWLRLYCDVPVALSLAASVYFICNTVQVASIIALTENRRSVSVWIECYVWMFPYYLLGAWMAGAFDFATRFFGFTVTILSLPMLSFVYHSYNLYLTRLQTEKERAEQQRLHAEEMSSLHLRTIEALALAIEAKDETTNEHLQRVQIYAFEVGKEMGLSQDELDALRAASLLHDIGKLAVPEHIISKPGKLTPEEFEKMKIHPVVGAEILECVQFPYDVVSVVRAHHEKWDGSGYPYGIKQLEIPVGARILSAVDCLDALASDRQYRRALPLDQAMQVVVSESGKAFDPKIVNILKNRYLELEELARSAPQSRIKLSKTMKIERGAAPDAGFEAAAPSSSDLDSPERSMDFLQSISAARQEAQLLFEMANEMGSSLRLDETLSMLAVRLKRLIPHNTIAVYRVVDNRLSAEFVAGDESRMFGSLNIPVGEGLSGWVVKNMLPIVNGNPSVEPGYLDDPRVFSLLRSALSAPLLGTTGDVVGVITLYEANKDAFSRDHLRILQAVSSKLGLTIENSLKFRRAEDSATLDFLTGLANARSLFVHLQHEVDRSVTTGASLAVLVGDLNGFKLVNDRLGHLEGNRLLQMTAGALRGECRAQDFVARMGGDEFVVILPDVNASDSGAVAERFAQAVERAWQTSDGGAESGIDLSLSLGIAHLGQDGRTPEELLAAADRRMYAVKAERKRANRSLLSLNAALSPGEAKAPEKSYVN